MTVSETTKHVKKFLAKPFAVSVVSFVALAALATAGSLTPSSAPGSTMQSLANIYNTIAGSFDSSGIASSSTGSLIEQLKFISSRVSTSFDPTGNETISGNWNFTGTLDGVGSDLTLARIGGSAFKTIQDMQNLFHSAGWLSGGAVSDIGGGKISVDAGSGTVRTSNSATAQIEFFDWPASNSITIPAGTHQNVGVIYNAGSPKVHVTPDDSFFDHRTGFEIAEAVNEGGQIFITFNPEAPGDHPSKMIQRDYETMPVARDVLGGGLILGESADGNRHVTMSAGAVWDRLNRFPIGAVDTGAGDTINRYYRDGSGGFTRESAQVQWPNNKYDDGTGTLATLPAGKYATLWFYVNTNGNVSMLYGRGQYSSARQAQAELAPATVPVRLDEEGTAILGRMIVLSGSSVAVAVQSSFDQPFPTLFDQPGIGVALDGTELANIVSLSFTSDAFTLDGNIAAGVANIGINYAAGPASRSIAQDITGAWTFSASPLALNVTGNASVSSTLEATSLKTLTLGSDSNLHISPGSGLTHIVGAASVSANFYALGNVGFGTTTVSPARVNVLGTTNDTTSAALSVLNAAGTPLLTVRNDGAISIGTTDPGQSALRVRPITVPGAANLSTVGSSTTVTTTGGAFSDVYPFTMITANSITRTVTGKTDDNTVTVDSAVDWSAGYPFTYENSANVSVDAPNDEVSRVYTFTRGNTIDWTLLNRANEAGANFYLRNGPTGRDILTVSNDGKMAINLPTVLTGTQPSIDSNLSVYPQSFDKVFAFVSNVFIDSTAGAANSQDTATSFSITPNTDFLYLGMLRTFSSAFLERVTGPSSAVVKAEYWNGSTWVTIGGGMGFIDGTNGFTQTGAFSWNPSLLTGWATTSVNGSAQLYYVRLSFTSYVGGPLAINMIVPGSDNRFDVFKAPLDSQPTFSVNGIGHVGMGDRVTETRLEDTSHPGLDNAALSIIDKNGSMRLWAFDANKSASLDMIAGNASIGNDLHWSMEVASSSPLMSSETLFFKRHSNTDHDIPFSLGVMNANGTSRTGALLNGNVGSMNGGDIMRGLVLDYVNNTHSGTGNQLRALEVGGITPSPNASESAFYVGPGWDYAFVASQGNVGIGTVTPSTRLEVVGAASASQLFGAGLSLCNSASAILNYDTSTGQFSCRNTSTLTDVPLWVREMGSSYFNAASISFSTSGFDVTNVADDARISLDYVNGPASRSIAQTITGHWSFTTGASISAPLEVSGALTASSSFFGAGLSTCNGTTQKVTWINGLFGCGVDQGGGGGGGGTLEVREFGAAFDSFPASLSFSRSGFNLTASGSSDVTIALDYVNGPASRSIAQTITGPWNFTGQMTILNASLSGGLEVTGYASASKTFGSGLTNCTGSNALQWNSSTGLFGCAAGGSSIKTESSGTTVVGATNTLNFDAGMFALTASTSETVVRLNWTSGPASRSASQTITGAWNFTAPLTTAHISMNSASVSTNLEVTGLASVSGNLHVSGNIAVGTTNPQFPLDVNGVGSFGDGTEANQTLLDFKVGHLFTMNYVTSQFGQATFDGMQFRNGNVGEANAFTVYASGDAHLNAVSQTNTANSSLIAMNNPNVANLTNATEGLLTNKATTHDIALQYSFGGSAPIDAILIDTNPTANAINSVIVNNANQAVSFRVAGTGDANLLYTDGASNVGIGTNAPVTKLEVQGTASASALLSSGGLQVAGNSFAAYSRFGTDVTTHSLSANNDLLISNHLEVDGNTFLDANASVALNFEVAGAASASKLFGSGLTTCNGTFSVLKYDASTGLFICSVEGGGVRTESGETTVVANNNALSFDAGMFSLAASGSTETNIRLDWTNGPASRSADQTITGHWTFNNASVSQTLEAAAVKTDSLVNSTGTLTIGAFTLNGLVTGNSQDIIGINKLSLDHASASGTVEAIQLRSGTIGSDAGMTIQPNGQLSLSPSAGNRVQINSSASVSGNFEVTGYSSSSQTFGSGLALCNGQTQKLIYAGGLFSCGTDRAALSVNTTGGTFVRISSLSFEANSFVFSNTASVGTIKLNWGANGVASRSAANTWSAVNTFSAGASISNAFELAGTASISGKVSISNNASISQNLEVSGNASASRTFGSGLTDCDSYGERVVWTASGSNAGKFSCATNKVTATYMSGAAALAANAVQVAGIFTNTNTTAFTTVPGANTASGSFTATTGGSFRGCSIVLDSNTTAGAVGVVFRRNGVSIGSTYCKLTTAVPKAHTETIQGNVLTFAAGDNIGVAVSTSAAFLPTGTEVMITWTVDYGSGADVAETYYTHNDGIISGMVVTLDSSLYAGVQLSSRSYDSDSLGVVTTNPGLILGKTQGPGREVDIALSGRVPVWVSTENGPVHPGDWLTTSSIPGAAMKATRAGRVIGQALTEYSGAGVGQVVMFVKNTQYDGERAINGVELQSSNANILLTALNQAVTTSASVSASMFSDRVIAGVDVVAPSITTHTLTTDTLRIGSGSFTFDDLVTRGMLSAYASVAADFRLQTMNREDLLSSAMNALQGDLASLSFRMTALDTKVASISAQLATGLRFTGPITIDGGLRVDSIGESGAIVNFLADTVFFGRPYFNADTAGFAVITARTRSVRITFDQPYESKPIVNVTLSVPATASMPAFAVSDEDETGFTISLGADAVADTGFNWSALAVKTPRTFRSQPTPTPDVATPTPTATPPPTQEPTASSSSVVMTPQPTPTPDVATPTPTPVPTPEPTPAQ